MKTRYFKQKVPNEITNGRQRIRKSSVSRTRGSNILARKAQEKKRELLRILRKTSPQTFEHTLGVTNWAVRIARELKKSFPGLDLEKVEDTALLHDIGKLGVNQQKLHVKIKLSSKDIEEIRQRHIATVRGFLGPDFSEEIVEGIISHHERFDGEGYPHGLQGRDIPLLGRILRVADEFQTHIEPRPFAKPIVSIPEAWNKILRGKEHSFDPIIVEALGSSLKKLGLI